MMLGDDLDITRHIGRLGRVIPDPGRAACVRRRCRAVLGRRQRRVARVTRAAVFLRQVVAPAIVGGLAAFYIVELVSDAVTVYRVFR